MIGKAALAVFLLAAGSAAARVDSSSASHVVGQLADSEVPKAVSASTVASRGFVTPSQTLYGGFSINNAATIYILVRGNSLGSLGITNNYLDAPRVRLFNQANTDLVFDGNGNGGFNNCTSTNTFSAPVVTYYQTRGQVQPRDSCIAVNLAAGVYTFTVTPSIPGVTTVSTSSAPSSGEVLFEVTLGP